MRSHAPLGRTWAPRGKTPVVATSGQRQSVNPISAVSPLGAFWYKVYTGRLNAGTFREFLKDFLKRRRRCAFLVVDVHPAHRARPIAAFVQQPCGRLELHFLPGYAPDLNPDEFVWNHMRHKGVTEKPYTQSPDAHGVERRFLPIRLSSNLAGSEVSDRQGAPAILDRIREGREARILDLSAKRVSRYRRVSARHCIDRTSRFSEWSR